MQGVLSFHIISELVGCSFMLKINGNILVGNKKWNRPHSHLISFEDAVDNAARLPMNTVFTVLLKTPRLYY